MDRLIDELALHARDSLEASGHTSNPAADQEAAIRALGDPEHIAAEAARRRGLASRLPLLTFIIAPIFGLPMAVIAHVLMASLLLSGYASLEPDPSSLLFRIILLCVGYAGFYGLPFAFIWVMVWLARRDELAIGWPLLSAVIAYLIHASMLIRVTPPAASGGSGSMALGLSFIAEAPLSSILLSAILFLPMMTPAWARVPWLSHSLLFSKT